MKNKLPLFILFVTALVCSRFFFHFLHDPEGANLIIFVGMAFVIYALSYILYIRKISTFHLKNTLLGVILQIVITLFAYLFLS